MLTTLIVSDKVDAEAFKEILAEIARALKTVRASIGRRPLHWFTALISNTEKTMMETDYPPLSPFKTGVRGLCPRCGQGRLFDGFIAMRKSCEVCDLDYSFADPADGPAFFVICFACIPSVLLAVWLEVAHHASVWTQLLVTGPFVALTCIPPLRPLKGWLVASQYAYDAREGRIVQANSLPPTPNRSKKRTRA